ncbi:phosphoribosyl transferase [Kitasatospora griseola]|uniref:Phosphoribosyl transferase n=1 Tax=Kitasatospora griseola TaxID=2064 RepID=A0A0D0NZM2_KITGR|nr:phosphoribosyltransferase family protein [Kitasatospora griseola]KIQ64651.1 phosphoribosyl transferase [Kitasatospora griseola]
MYFVDRVEAGRRLAARLKPLAGGDVVVLGLPRGGVPVAAEVAKALDAPLDVIVVRKLGVPFQPELGMGAIGEGGVRVVNEAVMRSTRTTGEELAQVEERERAELDRRARRYRGGRTRVEISGRTAVVVDDGIATGSTARAACLIARRQGAARVVLAVPVAPSGWSGGLADVADELVALSTPEAFFGIGQFYEDFAQTTDAEVVACLDEAPAGARDGEASGTAPRGATRPGGSPPVADPEVVVDAGGVRLGGQLALPEGAAGIVLFAHGSGSSRHSPRNRFVASALNRAGLATLLFDLLTEEEEYDRANVFDTGLLARRLTDATAWLLDQEECRGLTIGYFGASTGAAAALWAAAEPDSPVRAVVSRGGRPDLAGPRLPTVTAPTLLIVGGNDDVVIDLNRQAQARLRCENRLTVVPGATHLFEEPGALEEVANLATQWFTGHLLHAPHQAS